MMIETIWLTSLMLAGVALIASLCLQALARYQGNEHRARYFSAMGSVAILLFVALEAISPRNGFVSRILFFGLFVLLLIVMVVGRRWRLLARSESS